MSQMDILMRMIAFVTPSKRGYRGALSYSYVVM